MIALLMIGSLFYHETINADSGWDSDYDSGGRWDSGSDWDWGSDWDSSSNWYSDSDRDWSDDDWSTGTSGHSSHLKSGNPIIILIPFLLLVIVALLPLFILKIIRKGNNMIYEKAMTKRWQRMKNNIYTSGNINEYVNVDISKIKEIDPNINAEAFKTKVFRTYKDIQTAWMNFDTDTIRKLTTDEIYNMYSSQLETLKLKKQRNIMKDIELIDVKIIDIHKENDVITIDAYLNVRCYDYVIKDATGEVVRGTDKAKMNIKYKLSFIKSASNNKTEEKCPNCGAPVDIVSSAVCPYCDSTLVKDAGDYVMSKKVSLGQTLER